MMARSSAHRAGQIVGNVLEEAFYEPLKKIADDYGLFLDYQHSRPARNGNKFVRWTTSAGAKHNLDFVLERGGSEEVYGKPVAFVEIAWRRYTKHSRNKAGEISGALVPLARTHSDSHPFLGVIIAGAWTQGGLNDFIGNGIQVLHLESEQIVSAFSEADIDFSFGEEAEIDAIDQALSSWELLKKEDQDKVGARIRTQALEDFREFEAKLRTQLSRKVESISIVSSFGEFMEASTIAEASQLLNSLDIDASKSNSIFEGVRITVHYSNGDKVDGTFTDVINAVSWVENITS